MNLAETRGRLADSRALILVELAAVTAVFVADANHLILVSKTPYLLAIAWMSLFLRGARWRDLGLRLPQDWPRIALIGLAAGIGIEVMELFATQPILIALTGKQPDLSEVAAIRGNWQLLLLGLALTWTLAAVGEELAWRGWLLNRVDHLFGRGRPGALVAVIATSLAFGLAHTYQGITGVAENALDGALLAALYLATGRNLLAPMIAHGTTDTVDVSLIFSGHYPGM